MILAIMLTLVFTPLLLITSSDVCAYGPLNFLTHSGSSYAGDLRDFFLIGLISLLLVGYRFDWFYTKSAIKGLLLWLAAFTGISLVLSVEAILVNWHCWTF